MQITKDIRIANNENRLNKNTTIGEINKNILASEGPIPLKNSNTTIKATKNEIKYIYKLEGESVKYLTKNNPSKVTTP